MSTRNQLEREMNLIEKDKFERNGLRKHHKNNMLILKSQ